MSRYSQETVGKTKEALFRMGLDFCNWPINVINFSVRVYNHNWNVRFYYWSSTGSILFGTMACRSDLMLKTCFFALINKSGKSSFTVDNIRAEFFWYCWMLFRLFSSIAVFDYPLFHGRNDSDDEVFMKKRISLIYRHNLLFPGEGIKDFSFSHCQSKAFAAG